MKQITLHLITLLILALTTLSATAHDFEVDGIYYNIKGTEATVTYRGTDVDQFNEYIGDITIPETVTYGGTTYSVTSIGDGAFYNCTDLTDITIPNSVTSIGIAAFMDCSNLSNIEVPNSVISIGEQAFSGTDWFENQPDGLVYIGKVAYRYKGNYPKDTRVIIKEGTLGIACFSFGVKNFQKNNSNAPNTEETFGYHLNEGEKVSSTYSELIGVEIPNSVITIGAGAFAGCTGINNITIPNAVSTIDSCTFTGCSGLTSAIIGNSVTSIGVNAFDGCSNLTGVTCLASTPPAINLNAFPSDVTSQATLNVPKESLAAYQKADYWKDFSRTAEIVFEMDGIWYTALTDSTATVIQKPGEENLYQGDVVIPDSVTHEGYTFKVAGIDDEAFGNCYDLTSVVIGDAVESIGRQAFLGCTGLTNVIIPNSVTAIGNSAFQNCSGLAGITIGNSVTAIGNYAFSGCTGLTSIDIPNSVISIGDNAFSLCFNLTSITIGSSVTTIGDKAFWICDNVTNIIIPSSVISIGIGAFDSCNSLTNIFVDSGNPKYDSRDNCNAIIETATNTLIAGCMTTIIPNSITAIGNSAFSGLVRINEIDIPSSVTSIGDNAFNGCFGLTSVEIPNSVTSIGDYAFQFCDGLTSITIGNSVTTIGNEAFSYCSDLTSVTCLAITPPTIDSRTFPTDVTSQAKLYVLKESLAAYQAADYWKDFSRIVGIPVIDDFEVDGVWYRALTDNKAIVIQNQSDESFYQGGIVIPDTVSSQGYTFAVTAIDASAFEDCYDLASVVIGDAVETIGENAFQGCTGLTSVTIGSGVTSIGAKAFNYCNALTTVTCRGTVPPVMANANCFSNAAYSRAKLLVPRQQLEAYQAADYWYRFSNIEGWGSAGMGDVNADGTISISDVTALTNALLTNSTDPALLEYGDLNHNGRLDIGDVTNLIVTLLTH